MKIVKSERMQLPLHLHTLCVLHVTRNTQTHCFYRSIEWNTSLLILFPPVLLTSSLLLCCWTRERIFSTLHLLILFRCCWDTTAHVQNVCTSRTATLTRLADHHRRQSQAYAVVLRNNTTHSLLVMNRCWMNIHCLSPPAASCHSFSNRKNSCRPAVSDTFITFI